MFLLLITLLQQLFSGGQGDGSTPQRGAAEEQPSRLGTIGPRQTGPRGGATSPFPPPPAADRFPAVTPTFSPSPIPTPVPTPSNTPACIFRVTGNEITPTSCTLKTSEFIRIINADTVNRTIYSDPHDPSRATTGGVTSACGTLTPNETCRVYFLRTGTFGFHDHEQPDRKATVTVQ